MEGTDGLIVFPSRAAITARLAELVALRLEASIAERGRALFAASGGSTPKPLYEALSAADIDWTRVDATLIDERWVEPGAPGSNETFVRETLLKNNAANASFTGLKTDHADPFAAVQSVDAALDAFDFPIDVAVMGMGADGHTASWFPHAEGLDTALDPAGSAKAVAVRAQKSEVTGDFLDRMTLTLPAIASAKLVVLMMTGANKREAFEAALAGDDENDMPVRALLRAAPNLWACWAP
ncbi:MAG: 6-phosphogluconolactonase [Parvularculaceae bacterium]